ncbi:MAG TPA: DUF1801 domain-containing protein [Acidimicrobiales bacterium]|nr:DUF1801 domain-containing protein [Acidimicrobiales bacterium]
MRSDAVTIEGYLAELPEDRREALSAVRQVVLDHLPAGFEEVMQFGMISYVVPLERYPDTYNGQPLTVASLANQKRHMAIYLVGVYGDESSQRWLRESWEATGKKLDMGKSCVRFRQLDDLALDVVGEAIARIPLDVFIAHHERARSSPAGDGRPRAGQGDRR